MAEFQMQPRLCGERSLKPTCAKMRFCAQLSRMVRMCGELMVRDTRARWVKKWWLSIGAATPACGWWTLSIVCGGGDGVAVIGTHP